MARKKVLLIGNPILRRKSEELAPGDPEADIIIQDLTDTLKDLQRIKKIGRALAAPQIGVLKKVVFCNLPERSFALINPKITRYSQETFDVWDSCFSFDVQFFVEVRRFISIEVSYFDENWREKKEVFEGDMAELLQHELDHLEGILATDKLIDPAQIIMRQEWEERYR